MRDAGTIGRLLFRGHSEKMPANEMDSGEEPSRLLQQAGTDQPSALLSPQSADRVGRMASNLVNFMDAKPGSQLDQMVQPTPAGNVFMGCRSPLTWWWTTKSPSQPMARTS